jgi:hypothetical protein
MPYQTIPDVPTEANVSKLIGRLRANFVGSIEKNLDSLEQIFQSGCPDQLQSQKAINILNNIKSISVETTDRLSRFKKIPRPLTAAGKTLVRVAKGLKFIPFPPFFPGAKVSSAITTVQELGTQLRTTATSIELALSTTVDLDNLLKRAANVGERVDIALECCQLASNRGITIPSDLLYQLVSGTDSESSKALIEINKLLGLDNGTGGTGTGGTETGGSGARTGGSSLDGLGREFYTGPDGTVYTLEVIQVTSDFTRAPRRQAIAKNREGVKKFESSKSFSSSVDVLKREVKFRIDNSQV